MSQTEKRTAWFECEYAKLLKRMTAEFDALQNLPFETVDAIIEEEENETD